LGKEKRGVAGKKRASCNSHLKKYGRGCSSYFDERKITDSYRSERKFKPKGEEREKKHTEGRGKERKEGIKDRCVKTSHGKGVTSNE